MQGPPDGPERGVETPGAIAYRELVDEQAGRLVGYLYLLTGDSPRAESLAVDAFRQVWDRFRRADIFGDADDQLYRLATRGALQWMQRSGNDRGYQPPTTSPDDVIVAMGVVSGFEPQQRAAVLLVAWAGFDARRAAVATAVNEARVGDLLFAARQEYREAAGNEDFEARLRGLRISASEDTVRDGALAVPITRAQREPGALLRMARIAAGPLLLVVTLVILAMIFRECEGPTVKTGAGPTSDVAFAQAGGSIVVLDTGSGREIGRVPTGVLSVDGEQVYSTRTGCQGRGTDTTLLRSDTAIIRTDELGCLQGSVSPVAVDEARGLLYVRAAGPAGGTLQAVDLATLTPRTSLSSPPDSPGLFDAGVLVVSRDRSVLFGTAESTGGAMADAAVYRIDLPGLQLAGVARFPVEHPRGLQIVPIGGGRALAYDAGTGRLREVDPGRGQVITAIDLPSHTTVQTPGGAPARGLTVALSRDNRMLYIAVPDGGILVLDVAQGQLLRRVSSEHRYVAVAVSSDDRMLYAIESGGGYVVLDGASGNVLLRRPSAGLTDLLQVSMGQ